MEQSEKINVRNNNMKYKIFVYNQWRQIIIAFSIWMSMIYDRISAKIFATQFIAVQQ